MYWVHSSSKLKLLILKAIVIFLGVNVMHINILIVSQYTFYDFFYSQTFLSTPHSWKNWIKKLKKKEITELEEQYGPNNLTIQDSVVSETTNFSVDYMQC